MKAHQDHPRTGDGNSTVGTLPEAATVVTVYDHVPLRLTSHLWDLYRDAFSGIRKYAAQEHLMDSESFWELMADRRVQKFVATRDAESIGLSVMTTCLPAWPLVAPSFFERQYPGREVFYIGFVATRDHAAGVYAGLVERMYRDVIAADGVFVMDFCARNLEDREIARRVAVLVRRLNPAVRFERIDRQEWWAGDFRGEVAPTWPAQELSEAKTRAAVDRCCDQYGVGDHDGTEHGGDDA